MFADSGRPSASAYQGSKTAQIRLNNHIMAEYGEQVRCLVVGR